MRYVFAYGSLLNPGSLAATLPQLTPERCLPATCAGLRRVYGVAFPNDGSQGDKAYTDAAGVRPPVVLFWDVVADAEASVAGVCVPVTDAELAALRRRELRYDLREVAAIGAGGVRLRAATFVVKPRFTRADEVARGVVSASYERTVQAGVRFWDARVPGFADAVQAGTTPPDPACVRELTRTDATGDPGRGGDADPADPSATTGLEVGGRPRERHPDVTGAAYPAQACGSPSAAC